MIVHTAQVEWERGAQKFTDNRYSRGHSWSFDGGTVVAGSSSDLMLPVPLSRRDAVDPEEALVAALSSCHMLVFLALAAQRGLAVDRYTDRAEGRLETIDGKKRFARVVLRPHVVFADGVPEPKLADELHHLAHEGCYIANSVNFAVSCEARASASASTPARPS